MVYVGHVTHICKKKTPSRQHQFTKTGSLGP